MTDTSNAMVSEEWVRGLVAAAFGGSVPDGVSDWVDASLCAEHLGNSKLGVVASSNGGANRLRISSVGEADRLRALAKAQFPAASAWLDAHPEGEYVYETDGATLRIYGWAVPSDHGLTALVWDDGTEYEIGVLEAVPKSFVDAAAFIDGLDTTHLLGFVDGSGFARLFWTWDGASADVTAKVEGLGLSGLAPVVAHYAEEGLVVAPYSVEWGDGGVAVCAWGAYLGTDVSDLPEAFAAGAPDADTFAGLVAATLPPADQEAGLALTRDSLYPTLVEARADEQSVEDQVVEMWRFLVGLLALEVPTDRLLLLQRVDAANRLSSLQEEAFELAKMSYAASHPDSPAPEGIREAFASLDAGGIREAAQARSAVFETLSAIAQADPELDLHRFQMASFELPIIEDLLARASTGYFAEAKGPLHDYLVELGVTGYDDDPNLVSIDNVDLDADAQDAAIEEALAADFDEDDDF